MGVAVLKFEKSNAKLAFKYIVKLSGLCNVFFFRFRDLAWSGFGSGFAKKSLTLLYF